MENKKDAPQESFIDKELDYLSEKADTRAMNKKLLEEFLAKGGKIKKIPTPKNTEPKKVTK